MERSTIFHGKIHYFDWAIFNSKLLVYQRVAPTRLPWQGIPPSWSAFLAFSVSAASAFLVHGFTGQKIHREIPGENPPGPMRPEKNKAVPSK